MKTVPEPYKHQKEVLELSKTMNELALFHGLGCISGDMTVTINQNGAAKTKTFREAYSFYKNRQKDKLSARGLREDGNIGLNKIFDIVYSGDKFCKRITFDNGNILEATSDHEILTPFGFLSIDNGLKVGDKCFQQNSLKPKSVVTVVSKPNYHYTFIGEHHPFKNVTHRQNNWKNKTLKATHILKIEAAFNDMSFEDFVKATYAPNNLIFIDPKKIEIHHKDKNPKNNDIDNLLVLSPEEHRKLHAEEGRFNFNNFGYHEVTITNIEDIGMKDTYDIKCCSVHNFLANGIVVHNSGKTRSVIDIIRNIFNTHRGFKKTLILGPTSVVFNWRNEVEKYSNIPIERVYVCSSGAGRDIKLQKAIDQGAMIITINYEALLSEKIMKILRAWSPEILVCDEVHQCKNPSAKRSKSVFELAKLTKFRYILTGTPILKNTLDAFMEFKILDLGKTFGLNFWTFRAEYFMDKNAAWAGKQNHFPLWVPRPEKEKELLAKIAKKAHVVYTKDCIDLPPYINIIEKVPMKPDQKKAYEEMRDFFITFVNENAQNPAVAKIAPVKALRMMQVCAGHLTLDNKDTIDFGSTPKLERLEELLEEVRGNKFIIWTTFKADNKAACQLLDKLGIKYVKITGDQSTEEKQKAVDDFQNDPSVEGTVATLSAGGTGITLTKACYTFVLSRNFSLADNLQARARNYRSGSNIHEKIINYDLVIDGSIEEQVAQAINNKEEIGKMVLDWAKNYGVKK